MKARHLARGVDGHDRLAELDGAPREGMRQTKLLSGQIGPGNVTRHARDELVVGRRQEEHAPLDTGPQDERVEHLLEQGA